MVTGKSHNPTRFARFVLYPLAGVFFFVILSAVLILANGYRFTYTGGRVGLTKTGMLILSTRPFDATIALNGKLTKHKTRFYLLPTKISALKPGDYVVELKKKGYRTWRNTLEIKPNMVTWANYALLFPDELNVSEIKPPSGKVVASSENGRHLLFADDTATFGLKSVDTNNQAVKDFWPAATPLQPWLLKPKIISAQYSAAGDMALLRISNGERIEYVVVDSGQNPVKLVHLNATMAHDFTDAWWNTFNNNEIYLQSPSGISLTRVDSTTLPAPIASEIFGFTIDKSRQLLYVMKSETNKYSVYRMDLDGGNKAVLVDSIVPAKDYSLGYSHAQNTLAVLNIETGELTVFYSDNASKKTSLILSDGVKSFSWSDNGDFLLYYGDDFVKRYDFEKAKETVTPLSLSPTALSWYFDENHYLVTDTAGIHIMDYDGANVVSISSTPVPVSVLDIANSNIIFSNVDKFYKFVAEF